MFGERMRNARKRKGLTQKQLSEQLGVKNTTLSNWEKDYHYPDLQMVGTICSLLSVTSDELITGAKTPSIPFLYTDREITLLNKYRLLDAGGKAAVDALTEHYYNGLPDIGQLSVETASHIKVIPGLLSTQSAAAGTGIYLDDDCFEEISVVKNRLTERASFYVPVSGDSMEPKYHNGDILIVEKSPVKLGDIGIFTLDGNGFVKVLGTNELISLNKAYDPIPIDESIICNGKVIGTLEQDWIIQ